MAEAFDLVAESRAARMVWSTLKIVFGIVPIVAGLDKFTNLLVQWEKYIAPIFAIRHGNLGVLPSPPVGRRAVARDSAQPADKTALMSEVPSPRGDQIDFRYSTRSTRWASVNPRLSSFGSL
jgi:hypothetical protein